MKLTGSIIVTAMIIAAFWSLALFQPISASDFSSTQVSTVKEPINKVVPEDKVKPKVNNEIKDVDVIPERVAQRSIYGVSQILHLANINKLWQQFNQDMKLTASLIKHPKKIYVLYRRFSPEFNQALITIGYDANIVKFAKNSVAIPNVKYQPILLKAKYSNADLTNAWQEIDYRKVPIAVLETHYLSSNGDVINSDLTVAYQ